MPLIVNCPRNSKIVSKLKEGLAFLKLWLFSSITLKHLVLLKISMPFLSSLHIKLWDACDICCGVDYFETAQNMLICSFVVQYPLLILVILFWILKVKPTNLVKSNCRTPLCSLLKRKVVKLIKMACKEEGKKGREQYEGEGFKGKMKELEEKRGRAWREGHLGKAKVNQRLIAEFIKGVLHLLPKISMFCAFSQNNQ